MVHDAGRKSSRSQSCESALACSPENPGFAMSPPTHSHMHQLPPTSMALDMGAMQLKFESAEDVCCAVCLEVSARVSEWSCREAAGGYSRVGP
jgi:hypothetical protein